VAFGCTEKSAFGENAWQFLSRNTSNCHFRQPSRPFLGLGILLLREVGNVKVKVLLILVLSLSGFGYGSGPQTNGRPKIQFEHPVNPHLDIPKNCQKSIGQDDSVVLTCECEACGKADDDEAKDRDPWICQSRNGGLYCSYDLDTQTSEERRHSRI
jgi:hypothetical protein